MSWRREGGFEHLLACLEPFLGHGDIRERPVRVLEAGVGGGQVAAFLHDRLRDEVELSAFDVVDVARARESLLATDPSVDWAVRIKRAQPASSWPFEAESFDVFLAEHRRVLRPGGRAVHVFPSARLAIEPHLDVPFVHWFSKDEPRRAVLRATGALRLGAGSWRERGIDD